MNQKNILLMILALLFVTPKAQGAMTLDQKRWEKEAKDAREWVKSAKVITTAKILRNGSEIAIDFNNPVDLKSIKDYDRIRLDEGRYANFGDLKAKRVRMMGRGADKTLIASNPDQPIVTNGLELWDVSIVDTQISDKNGLGVLVVHSHLYGKELIIGQNQEQVRFMSLYTIFSDFTHYESKPMHFRDFMSYAETFDYNPGYSNRDFLPLGNSYDIPFFSAFVDGLNATQGKSPLGPKLSMNFEEQNWKNFLAIVKAEESFNQQKLFAEAMGYLVETRGVKIPADNARAKALMAKGMAAKKNGNELIAAAFFREADFAEGFKRHDELKKLALTTIKPLREGKTCHFSDPVGDNKIWIKFSRELRLVASEKLPYLDQFLEQGTACEISFYAVPTGKVEQFSSTRQLGTETVRVESEASKQKKSQAAARQAVLNRAAERSARKTRVARMEAASESMKQVTDKAKEGRFRIEEDAGGDKTMVYGSGNWGGAPSEATKAAHEDNKADAENLRDQAKAVQTGDTQYEDKVLNKGETVAGKYDKFTVVGEFYAGKVHERLTGVDLSVGKTTICQTDNKAGFTREGECQTLETNYSSYVRTNFTDKFLKLLKTHVLSGIDKEAAAKSKSADPTTRLEGLLMTKMYVTPNVDTPEFLALSKKVFGEELKSKQIMQRALYY
jgi:hypothetical protein